MELNPPGECRMPMLVRRELFRFISLVLITALPALCWSSLAADPAPAPSSPSASSRIVDGALQDASDFPSVGLIVDTAQTFSCTGTLIDANHVLTAAHCGVDESTNKALPGNGLNFRIG